MGCWPQIRNARTLLNVGDSKLVIYVPSWFSEPASIASKAQKLVAVHIAKIIIPTCDSKLEGPLGSLSIYENDEPFLNKVNGAVRKAQEQNRYWFIKSYRLERSLSRRISTYCQKAGHLPHNECPRGNRSTRSVSHCSRVARYTFVKRAHDLKEHCGISRMKEHLRMLWWINMDEDCANYVRSCTSCL